MRLYDYAASGNCYKPRLLLALLGREYERVPVDIFAGDTLTDEYARLNRARETPVLELDDGTVVTQSNAILWLVGEGTPCRHTRSSAPKSCNGCSSSRSAS
jgi:glutathione S-transferase